MSDNPIGFESLVKKIEGVFKIQERGENKELQVRWVKIVDRDWEVRLEEEGTKMRAVVSLLYPNYRLTFRLDPLDGYLIDPDGRPLILESNLGTSTLEIKLWKSR